MYQSSKTMHEHYLFYISKHQHWFVSSEKEWYIEIIQIIFNKSYPDNYQSTAGGYKHANIPLFIINQFCVSKLKKVRIKESDFTHNLIKIL
jgi:hypothetical protein